MPTRPLPKKLVSKLTELVKKAGERRAIRFLGRLKNIDPRKKLNPLHRVISPQETTDMGFRVRELNVTRNFRNVKSVVIKRVHSPTILRKITAKEQLAIITNSVKIHNKKVLPKRYVLVKPIAYPIGEELISMNKTEAPSISDAIHYSKAEINANPILRKIKFNSRKKEQLRKAYYEFFTNSQIPGMLEIKPPNLLVTGYKNGKFIFTPLIDLF